MATSIPLLHSWDNEPIPTAHGLFPIGDGVSMPARWQLQVSDIDARALPTPFAGAEAMRLVLGRAEEAPAHDLLSDFKWLLLGIASGVLRIEPSDLTDERFDGLGRALIQVDPEARYFSRIVWSERSLPFGATYRSCLVWGHSRRSRSDWNKLSEAIQPWQTQALAVLADWREAIRRAGRWIPGRVSWQRGVDQVIGTTEPHRELWELHENTVLVGPVWLELPTDRPEEPLRAEPVYLPAYSPGFAGRFVSLCKFQPRAAKEAIEFVDARGVVIGRIRLPPSGKDRDLVAMGMGIVDASPGDTPQIPVTSPRLWVQGAGGIVEMLRPLQHALESVGRPVTSAAVAASAPFYPDPIRILFRRGLWPGAMSQNVYTGRATLLLASSGHMLPEPQDAEASGGAHTTLDSGTNHAHVVLMDRLGDIDLLDLRALGAVLFRVFVHQAGVLPELNGNLGDTTTLEALMLHSSESPLEPTARIYESVSLGPPAALQARLATLQRFVRAYRSEVAGIERVFDRAARSFARWATGLPEVAGFGRKGAKSVSYRLSIGYEVHLAVDALGAG